MKLGSRCTTCGGRVDESNLIECNACGRLVHDRCKRYETTFECPECAEEKDVGAVEL